MNEKSEKQQIELDALKFCSMRFGKLLTANQNQKQKLIYNLLNSIRANNQNEFFSIISMAINAHQDKNEAKELAEKVNYSFLSDDLFIKRAYSIILGIMASKDANNKNEKNNGGIENE